MPSSAAAAFAAARETPRIAFAPRRPLFGVPSSSTILRSSPAWSSASTPATAEAISPLTFATAVLTPLPAHAAPPSRSSTASNSPVEAPDGTAARPRRPPPLPAPRAPAPAAPPPRNPAGGGPRRPRRPPRSAGRERHLDLDRRVAAAVEHLPGVYLPDLTHRPDLPPSRSRA